MNLGQTIDQLYELRAKRLELEREVKDLKANEDLLKDSILNMLGDSKLASARGAVATASVVMKTKPIVTNWEDVYTYIVDNNRFDLLHQRISSLAWGDLEKSGILVPGTEAFTEVSLSLTKAKR